MSSLITYSVISILLTPLLTYISMHAKSAMCNSHPRMPALFATDMRLIIVTNVFAQIFLVAWVMFLPLNLSFFVAIDLLFGIPIEHWILKTVFLHDDGYYHIPGEYAQRKLKRRYSLALIFSTLIRSSIAAFCIALQTQNVTSLSLVQLLVQLLLYTFVRTLFVDCMHSVEMSQPVTEQEVRTDSFVITDEEEDNMSAHDEL